MSKLLIFLYHAIIKIFIFSNRMIKKLIYSARLFTVIFFLKQILSYNDYNFKLTSKLYKYHKYFIFSILALTLTLSYYNNKSLALILSVIIIIYLDKYHNFIESFHNKSSNDKITLKELELVRKDCIKKKWNNKVCKKIKEQIIEFCQKKTDNSCPPWKMNQIKQNNTNFKVDCPQLFFDIYPKGCEK